MTNRQDLLYTKSVAYTIDTNKTGKSNTISLLALELIEIYEENLHWKLKNVRNRLGKFQKQSKLRNQLRNWFNTMIDFYESTGKMALGSRLRRLSEKITEDAREVYALYGIDIEPKWFPVIYVLDKLEYSTVTEVAESIGHSHPSVSNIAKEMKKNGLLEMQKSRNDGRKRELRLTIKGKKVMQKINKVFLDMAQTVDSLFAESHHDLWAAMEDMEYLLGQKSLLKRVQEQRKIRESSYVEIVDYQPRDQAAFARLNYHWIRKYFAIEETDRKSLDHPEETILQPGGYIFMAKYKGEVVGTVAMVKMEKGGFELAKMAVDESVQGLSIGWRLGKAVIDKAKSLGTKRLYLESNTLLTPAINLYHKLGFVRIVGPPSPYERSNIQMELWLEKPG